MRSVTLRLLKISLKSHLTYLLKFLIWSYFLYNLSNRICMSPNRTINKAIKVNNLVGLLQIMLIILQMTRRHPLIIYLIQVNNSLKNSKKLRTIKSQHQVYLKKMIVTVSYAIQISFKLSWSFILT